ncbi:MAG: hypothetical protein A4E25_00414 [Methanobacterium sp. PtaB.Bin024]|nr:MAG: hypothetical protein A4E25_00414 [Methanobacterium sp. PtaB.Bin024]
MKKNVIAGLITILIVVVMASGCVSSDDTSSSSQGGTPQTDIELGNTPVVTQIEGETTMIGGLLQNNGQNDYKNVQIEVSGLDVDGNVISSKISLIAIIKADDYADYDVDLPYNAEIVAGDVKILNATAV